MKNFTETTNCRVCNHTLLELLKIPEQYIGSNFVKNNTETSQIKVPMTLMLCENCKLVQLKETTNPDLLYTNYFYRTGINDTMKRDLKELVDTVSKHVKLEEADSIIDIGANDMTMLDMFDKKLNRIGVEPAKNINWDNLDPSINIINDYFTKEIIDESLPGIKAKLITSCACFYDMPDPNKTVRDVKDLLHDDGIVIIQLSYLLSTIKNMNWQDIVHEHLEYYSLESLEYLLEKNGLSIFHATENFVNGGSIRVYVTHKDRGLSKSKAYYNILKQELEYKLSDVQTYEKFNNKIELARKKIKKFILSEIENGGKVFALAASTKGNMLLQLCELDNSIIPFISDRNPEKHGLYTYGTHIKIISEERARELNPTMMFVLTFHFKDEIIKREKQYLEEGGKLLFVMPHPYYVDKNGEHLI